MPVFFALKQSQHKSCSVLNKLTLSKSQRSKKFMSQYNESEKILLLHQYVTSGLTLHEFSSRHGIPLSTFHRIYTEYGSPDVSSVAYLMKKEDIPVQLEELQAQLLRERKAHEKEIKRLEKELAVEKLYGLANKTMIDLSEKKYNIRIRKNSAAK